MNDDIKNLATDIATEFNINDADRDLFLLNTDTDEDTLRKKAKALAAKNEGTANSDLSEEAREEIKSWADSML